MSDTKPRAPLRAPRGPVLSCRNWLSEAALRMLMNNLDPEVAERPDDLVVYGGIGKAARNWQCFDQIVTALRGLGEDESLLIMRRTFSQGRVASIADLYHPGSRYELAANCQPR